MKFEEIYNLLNSLNNFEVVLTNNLNDSKLNGCLSVTLVDKHLGEDNKIVLLFDDKPMVIFNKPDIKCEGVEGEYVTITEGDFAMTISRIFLQYIQ